MRAAAIDRFGGPAALKLRELGRPAPGPEEVLIRVHTAGVASWDAAMRAGWWPFGRPRFPLVLGTDGSGVVAAVGSKVRRLRVGDRVMAFAFPVPKGGFYAEYVAIRAMYVVRLPRGLDLGRAGAITCTGLTALQGVDDALRLKKGETVIVHGASGGVGSLAVQFARLRGARVLATASGRDGRALVRRLGAEAVVDARREDVAEAAKRFAPGGVDAVLAFAGGKALTRCLDALRKGGRLAYPHGIEPAPRKRRGLRVRAYDGVSGLRELERLRRAVAARKLVVPVDSVFSLGGAAAAHRRLGRGHILGKVVLRVR